MKDVVDITGENSGMKKETEKVMKMIFSGKK